MPLQKFTQKRSYHSLGVGICAFILSIGVLARAEDERPDSARLLEVIAAEGPSLLKHFGEYANSKCRFEIDGPIKADLRLLKDIPRDEQKYCALPVILRERERVLTSLKNSKTALELRPGWSMIDLRAGWWNLKPFVSASIDPNLLTIRLIVLNEALRRSVIELKSEFDDGPSSASLHGKNSDWAVILAWLESPQPILQVTRFFMSVKCDHGSWRDDCKHMRSAIGRALAGAVNANGADFTRIQSYFYRGLPNGLAPAKLNRLKEVIVVDDLFQKLKEGTGGSLTLLQSVFGQGVLSDEIVEYRRALEREARISKELTNQRLTNAVLAAVHLHDARALVLVAHLIEVEAQISKVPSGPDLSLRRTLEKSLRTLLNNIDTLIFERETDL